MNKFKLKGLLFGSLCFLSSVSSGTTNHKMDFEEIVNSASSCVVAEKLSEEFIKESGNLYTLTEFKVTHVGFGDIGTAWTGQDPYSEENDQIKEEIDQGSVQITLKKSNEPIVGAYGFGIRMALLGYYMRIDWAWGIENDIVQDRIVHFSLSLDI